MSYTLEEKHLKDLLADACEIGFKKGLMTAPLMVTQMKPYISKRESYRLYGRRSVDRWIAEKLVREIKDGENNSGIRIDRIQIELVAKACNRANCMTTRKTVSP
jgi:hypothetical protein